VKRTSGNQLLQIGSVVVLAGVLLLAVQVFAWLVRQAMEVIAVGAVLMLIGLFLKRKAPR
jgi:hypothetical protein